MKVNRSLIGLFLFHLVILPVKAQLADDCFNRFLKEAFEAQKANNFDLAVHKFEAANICPDKPLVHQLDSLLKSVNLLKIKALTRAKDRADKSAAKAQKLLRTSEGSRLAFLANQEREKGNTDAALKLAFHAMQTVDSFIPFAIQRAFGDAVYRSSLKTLQGHKNGISHIEFSKKENKLLSIGRDSSIIVWDTSGQQLFRWKASEQAIQVAHFSPDGQSVLVGSGSMVQLMNMQGKIIRKYTTDQSFIYQTIFSNGGDFIAAGTRNHTLYIWNKAGQLQAKCLGIDAAILDLQFSKEDQFLMSLSADKAIRIWDLNGQLIQTFKHKGLYFGGATFGTNPNQIISHTVDHAIQIWDVQSGQLTQTFQAHQNKIQSLEVAPHQAALLTCSSDKKVIYWTLEGQALLHLDNHVDRVNQAIFSKDGSFLLTGSKDGTAKLFDQEGHLLMDLSGFGGAVNEVSFSPNDQLIAAIGPEPTVYLCQHPKYYYDYLKKIRLPILRKMKK